MEPEELTDQAIDYILDGVDLVLLSEWDRNFIESVTDQWTRNRRLSEKQKEILGKIWDKHP
jgi:hypothetical protein